MDRLLALGLTFNEAKTYLAVVKLGLCKVSDIGHATLLQRPDIYHTMPRLVSSGLVEETLDRPKRYRATDIQNSLANLRAQALQRFEGIANGTELLIDKLQKMQPNLEIRGKEAVRIITGLDGIIRNFREMIGSVEKEIFIMAPSIIPPQRGIVSTLLKTIRDRHLNARMIMPVEAHNASFAKRLSSATEVRHSQALNVHLYVVDRHTAVVGLNTTGQTDPERTAELVTTYPSFVKAIREFYEATWREAIPLEARLAILQGDEPAKGSTSIIWGRETIFQKTSSWHQTAKARITEIVTTHGPARLLAAFEKGLLEAKGRKTQWRLICHLSPENASEVRKLATIAQVRHADRPFGMHVVIRDSSEAIIHYVDPDSPYLATGTDMALHTTDPAVALNLGHMLDAIWRHSEPIDKALKRYATRTKANPKNRKP